MPANPFDIYDDAPEANPFDVYDTPEEPQTRRPVGQPARAFGSAANEALAQGLGAVVDIPVGLAARGQDALFGGINRMLPARLPSGLSVPDLPTNTAETLPRLGDAIEKGFNVAGVETDFEPTTQAERVLDKAGAVAGGGVGALAGGVGALRAVSAAVPGSRLSRILAPVTTPSAATTAAELGAISGATQGAGLAELAAPGDPNVALAAEITGGVINPLGTLSRVGPRAAQTAVNTARSFTPGGREQNAARVVQNLLIESGENPQEVARVLRDNLRADPAGVNLTAGVSSGSTGLLRLESSIAKMEKSVSNEHRRFDTIRSEQLEDSFEAMRGTVLSLSGSGDPTAVRMAVKLRQEYFDDLIKGRLDVAKRGALQAAAKVEGYGRGTAGVEAENAIRSALSEARGVERKFWDLVPENLPVSTTNLKQSYDSARASVLLEESLPFERTIIRLLGEETASVTSGDLIVLRSRLLEESRRLSAAGDKGSARRAGDLARGILDDLSTLQDPDIDNARAYSRALNDNFTRTFAGRVAATDGSGQTRINPEDVLDLAFAKRRGVSVRELRKAGAFVDPLYEGQVRNAQEQWLLSAAQETVEDGAVNPARLQTFLRNNADALQEFPDVQQILSDARLAEVRFREVQTNSQRLSKDRITRQRVLFEHITQTEDIAGEVGRILRGSNPRRQIARLSAVARRGGPDAVEGLKTAALDAITTQSTSEGVLDFIKLNRNFEAASDTLVGARVMTKQEASRYRVLVQRAADIQARAGRAFAREDVIEGVDMLTDLVIRIAGARVGSQAAQGAGSGASLVAAGAASRAARSVFEKIPMSRTQDVLIEAARDPAFMAKLLEKPATVAHKRALETEINAFLLQTGIVTDEDEE